MQVQPTTGHAGLLEALDGLLGGRGWRWRRRSSRVGDRGGAGAFGGGAGHVLLEREDETEVDDAEDEGEQEDHHQRELDHRRAGVVAC